MVHGDLLPCGMGNQPALLTREPCRPCCRLFVIDDAATSLSEVLVEIVAYIQEAQSVVDRGSKSRSSSRLISVSRRLTAVMKGWIHAA